MKKILFISPFAPYDAVSHAGGKTLNFYLKKFNAHSEFEVKIITFYDEHEKNKLDFELYNIDHISFEKSSTLYKKVFRLLLNFESRFNPFNRYANMLYFTTIFKIIKTARKLKKANYQPDIIILEWSQILFLSTKIRKIFPNSIIIANEYDVSFLGQEREYLRIEKGFKKSLKNIKYLKMKKVELNSMTSCHLIVTQNVKDFELLLNEGIAKEKQLMIAPFFTNMIDISRENINFDIIFFGAMNRKENYLSAIWFIENVFNHIQDNRIKFIIIGANPHKSLFRYASKKIIITGYVSDINLYFSNSLCMVAPLVLGAGIKVKILEGLSAGIPILTNNIGIEGIPAKDEVHYIFCNTPNDYLNNIYRLINCTSYSKNISINAKHFMVDNFNYEKSFENYVKKINSLFIK